MLLSAFLFNFSFNLREKVKPSAGPAQIVEQVACGEKILGEFIDERGS